MTRSITRRTVALALFLASLEQFSLAQDPARDGISVAPQAAIPPETTIRLVLRSQLNSKLNQAGDVVTATLAEPVYVEGQLLLPRGTEFRGQISKVAKAKRGQRSSHMSIDFDHVMTASGEVPISARVTAIDDWDTEESIKANSKGDLKGGHRGEKTVDNTRRGAQIGLSGGVAGAALGGAAGASGRAVFGLGGAGLAAGMIAGFFLTKGSDIRVRPGAILRVKLSKPITLPVTTAPSNSIQ
jgi:hypothetical protein